MSATVKVNSDAIVKEAINIYLQVDDKQIEFPECCCICLSETNIIIKKIDGKRIYQSREAAINQSVMMLAFGLLGNASSNKPIVLQYNGKAPYCSNCEKQSKNNPGVVITSFDKENIEFTFQNQEYSQRFLELNDPIKKKEKKEKNSSIKQIDNKEGRVVNKTCSRCGGINPPNAYFCKSCGSHL
jgi:ribosomal protein L40E